MGKGRGFLTFHILHHTSHILHLTYRISHIAQSKKCLCYHDRNSYKSMRKLRVCPSVPRCQRLRSPVSLSPSQ